MRHKFSEVLLALVTSNLFAVIMGIMNSLRFTPFYTPEGAEWFYLIIEAGLWFIIGFAVFKFVANGIVKLLNQKIDVETQNLFRIKKLPVE